MKVRDLLEKLTNADPERDVYVSPLKVFPSMKDSSETVADPFTRFPVGMVAEMGSLVKGGPDNYIVIGFDAEKMDLLPDGREPEDGLVN